MHNSADTDVVDTWNLASQLGGVEIESINVFFPAVVEQAVGPAFRFEPKYSAEDHPCVVYVREEDMHGLVGDYSGNASRQKLLSGLCHGFNFATFEHTDESFDVAGDSVMDSMAQYYVLMDGRWVAYDLDSKDVYEFISGYADAVPFDPYGIEQVDCNEFPYKWEIYTPHDFPDVARHRLSEQERHRRAVLHEYAEFNAVTDNVHETPHMSIDMELADARRFTVPLYTSLDAAALSEVLSTQWGMEISKKESDHPELCILDWLWPGGNPNQELLHKISSGQ